MLKVVTVTAGTIKKRNSGDQIKVIFDVTAVANSETLNVTHLREIEDGYFNCTTDDQTSMTFSGNTITFLNGATLAGKVTVWGY